MVFKKIKGNDYFTNISTMAGGVFLSQIITILLSPILTRLYGPESFGLIASFLAIVNILTVVATLRYENVLVMPDKDQIAKNIMAFAILLVLGCSITYFLIIAFVSDEVISLFFDQKRQHWIFWVPFMVLVNGLFYLFRNWLIRKKSYKTISAAGVFKSVSLNGVLLTAGILNSSPENFLLANIIAQIVETSYLYFRIYQTDDRILRGIIFKDTLNAAHRYREFPKYSLVADLVNVFSVQNPVLLLSFFFGVSTVGFFSLTERILGVPVKVISSSTLEVYKQKAAEEYSINGNCKDTFIKTFKYLVVVAIVPTLAVAFLSPAVFEWAFGDGWKQAGIFAQLLSIKFFFQLTVRPLGFTLLIAGMQRRYLYWQIGLLGLTSAGLFAGILIDSEISSVLLYSVTYSFMYLVYFLISYRASKPK